MRDEEVRECKAAIGAGCKLKMTENGDILIKMVGKGNVFVQNTLDETAVSNDILKLYSGRLEHDRAMKLFDIKKFKQNLNREGKRKHPDWKKIENQVMELIRKRKYLFNYFQAISSFSFVKNKDNVLECPVWVMLINIVALEMIDAKKSKYRCKM